MWQPNSVGVIYRTVRGHHYYEKTIGVRMASFSTLIEHMLTKVHEKFCGDTSVSFEVKHCAILYPKRAFFLPQWRSISRSHKFFLFKGEPEDVAAHKLVRICLNTSCIRVPKRSFLATVVFELYRVAGKCDRSPRSTLH